MRWYPRRGQILLILIRIRDTIFFLLLKPWPFVHAGLTFLNFHRSKVVARVAVKTHPIVILRARGRPAAEVGGPTGRIRTVDVNTVPSEAVEEDDGSRFRVKQHLAREGTVVGAREQFAFAMGTGNENDSPRLRGHIPKVDDAVENVLRRIVRARVLVPGLAGHGASLHHQTGGVVRILSP